MINRFALTACFCTLFGCGPMEPSEPADPTDTSQAKLDGDDLIDPLEALPPITGSSLEVDPNATIIPLPTAGRPTSDLVTGCRTERPSGVLAYADCLSDLAQFCSAGLTPADGDRVRDERLEIERCTKITATYQQKRKRMHCLDRVREVIHTDARCVAYYW